MTKIAWMHVIYMSALAFLLGSFATPSNFQADRLCAHMQARARLSPYENITQLELTFEAA
jgi:hypothetical protein